ncbi:MAG TPA: quinolinate synthase NadA [Dehalococcoidales bacterium]|nr:quinolinate synthase NadA [Dehalococcoidales bacterium]
MQNDDAALLEKIQSFKKSRNAVLIAHNYQLGEIQDIADFVGGCLEMSREIARTKADVIVLCGVQFMAEAAAIIHPEKTVLLPDLHANCPLANMITVSRLREMKKEHPDAIVVAYLKSPAAIMAEADSCCATDNAVRIIEKLPKDREIIFVPDQYVGNYVATQTGRDLILWPGFCSTHLRIQPRDITRLKSQYPQAKVVVHPQCRPEVIALADYVASTKDILAYAHKTNAEQFIIGTEVGILHRLRKENPDKSFFPASEEAVCHRMKLIRLETILWSLENMTHQVTVPERILRRAKPAVMKMLDG